MTLEVPRHWHYLGSAPTEARLRHQWWDVTGTVGGFILATVKTIDWSWLFYGLIACGMFADCSLGWSLKKHKSQQNGERKNKKTGKVVDMGKSLIHELAKAAPITVLFHTVGIDALSL